MSARGSVSLSALTARLAALEAREKARDAKLRGLEAMAKEDGAAAYAALDRAEEARLGSVRAQETASGAESAAADAKAEAEEAKEEARFAQDQGAALWDAMDGLGGDTSGREPTAREVEAAQWDWDEEQAALCAKPPAPASRPRAPDPVPYNTAPGDPLSCGDEADHD